MDIYEVLEYLPQRYPILMIDKVKECDPGKHIIAIKNVSLILRGSWQGRTTTHGGIGGGGGLGFYW